MHAIMIFFFFWVFFFFFLIWSASDRSFHGDIYRHGEQEGHLRRMWVSSNERKWATNSIIIFLPVKVLFVFKVKTVQYSHTRCLDIQ